MTPDDRSRLLESINESADKIVEIGRAFDRMRFQCEKPATTDAFLQLTNQAGKLTLGSLDQLATLLECLYDAGVSRPVAHRMRNKVIDSLQDKMLEDM